MQTAYVIPIDDLQALIDNAVEKKFQAFCSIVKEPEELITRKQAAEILGITLPTLGEWVKSGKVPGYRIGTSCSVRFKRSEVENSLQKIKVA